MKKIFLGIVTCIMAVSLLSACGSSKSVDLTDYFIVNFSGVDGNGKASLDFDFTQLEKDLVGDDDDNISKEELEKLAGITKFETSIKCDIDKSEGLSNGDKVTVKVSYNEEAAKEQKIKVSGKSSKEFEVTGLKEPIELDAFNSSIFNVEEGEEGIYIKFEGTSPNIMISIQNWIDKENPLSKADYSIEGDAQELNTYENGQEITIVASLPEELMEEGYVLKEDKTIITIGGVDEYISSIDDLTDEDWSIINSKINDFKTENFSGGTYSGLNIVKDSGNETILKFSDVTFDKAYMLNAKGDVADDFFGENSHNRLSIRFKMNVNKTYVELIGENETSTDVYGMIYTTNLKRTSDGELEIDDFYIYENCYPSESEFEAAVIDAKSGEFTIENQNLK